MNSIFLSTIVIIAVQLQLFGKVFIVLYPSAGNGQPLKYCVFAIVLQEYS